MFRLQYVQTCLRLDRQLYFKLINIESTTGSGKKRCLSMIQEAIKQEEERKKPQSNVGRAFVTFSTVVFPSVEFGGRSNETRQVWNEKEIAARHFSLRILSGQLIPAGEFDEVSRLTSVIRSSSRFLGENHHRSVPRHSAVVSRLHSGQPIGRHIES